MIDVRDVAELKGFTRIIGKPVEYRPVSDDIQRKTLLEYGIPAWIASRLVEYSQAYAPGWGDHTSPTSFVRTR